MSMVTILVAMSQYLRSLSVRMKNKAIKAIKDRIAAVEAEQVELEESRSNRMVDCHKRYYASYEDLRARHAKEVAELLERHETEQLNLKADFEDNKRTIALTSQAASNELKRELAMLGTELDNLTK
ncbi:polysaccharide chain length determinant protein [Salmonella phage BP12B]|uniref:Uncharacterized protein n=1 Tax=Salmonella phage BP12B TaxID=1543201 RepID=A0A140XFR9_9CAUD|nr:polysaccharide chain length determinant protein [Salmonella phage BP12B]AIT13689.1 hypothetical protein BP12B_14 [Salmonella phage BP12B]EGX1369706.1 hypothetical protein [Salmonella enterica subsp. enterica serovar Typhimurium]